ncbi:Mov34/MPN/PAD-1 family protein [Burkholderia sp. Ac-20379]|uniref:Mov34/MPN/PAD-1 family protein n=1 Tax=Burkholderia sp. Ac-20379 TaxID=2703900 RepID=UPI00197DA5B9|nr:Mov34/MPN/PAD-1 family protein [Burkholderia sp. Ac-20379]MBN3724574.1 sulfurylase [Burkholderia sp. Ac-20379]
MHANVLTRGALGAIYRHARDTYPKECCGFVLADASVKEGTNIQDELHAADPRRYQRSAANGYTFSVADTVFLHGSFKTPNPVSVLYHSHPDVGAYFSREDIDKALYAGEPVLPVDYLVVDVAAGIVRGAKLFAWCNGRFECRREFGPSGADSSGIWHGGEA